ncbi:MAG: energy transducer TonB, partial [Nitrospinae bacterium]|nr:energy transducer TonB [Nitrospinota bacterium]
ESKVLAELKRLENKWRGEKDIDIREEKETTEKSNNTLEELRELEKKWSEEGMRNEIKVQEKRGEGINVKKEGTIGGGYSSLTMEDMDRFPGLNAYHDGIVKVINHQDEVMLRYQDMVKQRIEDVRRYPLVAKRQGIEGVVYLNFIILSDGLTQDVKIIHSSDSKILDDEAVATIKRANPFPPIPKEISTSQVEMEISIVFTPLERKPRLL